MIRVDLNHAHFSRAVKNSTVVPRGGAIDMEISKYLRQHSRTIAWKSQLFINSYAKALEVHFMVDLDVLTFVPLDFTYKKENITYFHVAC
ncbi:hypothetical protein ARALYDRAFT_918449 [Arabidopsis lyrata subsp. lyrata]|uniref:Uncharacterized protein n=1 Tax=Arabidopsis lyrata subsp. lyrata TaxID=81972 RepID=D7MT11_ARALL|nr:hypothetical protein ARALYDRAFT_918449 [Arabidopsis lyrata subsp. lyrata]